MCMVSSIGDNYRDNFPSRWPSVLPTPLPSQLDYQTVSRTEFNLLKVEVEELKKLLLEAKKFDEATNQPHCETDDKVAFLKKIAEFVGVNLDEVFK